MDIFPKRFLGNEETDSAHSAQRIPTSPLGLGPKQLNWLRLNIGSFRHAEDQRARLHEDCVRAARDAGLI